MHIQQYHGDEILVLQGNRAQLQILSKLCDDIYSRDSSALHGRRLRHGAFRLPRIGVATTPFTGKQATAVVRGRSLQHVLVFR